VKIGVNGVVAVLGPVDHRALAGGDLNAATVGHQGALIEGSMAAERLAGAGGRVRHQVVGAEIVGESFTLVLGRGVEQPHQQEERHHRGDEIGVRDLPGAAVVAALDDFILLDDDSALGAFLLTLARHVGPPESQQ
jgi:hypothetical protein